MESKSCSKCCQFKPGSQLCQACSHSTVNVTWILECILMTCLSAMRHLCIRYSICKEPLSIQFFEKINNDVVSLDTAIANGFEYT